MWSFIPEVILESHCDSYKGLLLLDVEEMSFLDTVKHPDTGAAKAWAVSLHPNTPRNK